MILKVHDEGSTHLGILGTMVSLEEQVHDQVPQRNPSLGLGIMSGLDSLVICPDGMIWR